MNRLERIPSQKMIGGVAAGIASYLNTDTALIRVVFVLGAFFTHAPFILAYIILWIALPKRQDGIETVVSGVPSPRRDNSKAWGIVAILFGSIFLLDEFTWWFTWHKLWPALFIIAGLGLIFRDQIREKIA
ncbi:PspC domain-containing protein [Siphonobacter aquaeclarae]|jgi:phage shock protein C|uniref:Phage shock protein C (PspC) family protein n=1 Tax=Siphonobacter aquaeclarae TaxID=563176 RepID=A0A1G9UDM2_9BACT|nr:PspC domain-containing protein [Siphonobacter aquaeclarae]MBO9637221.1 PspC domain-containing protein [Siphonobacter aquaeclarae]SDM57794.1 phage shock protein C (PspC) family protein [Siphonobacter aquaeclarae]